MGLYYYNARWYDPTLGRFTSPDLMVRSGGNPANLDRYAYVRNNPVAYNDPSGHWANETLKPIEEQRRDAYGYLAEKTSSGNGFLKEYYLVASGYYNALASDDSIECVESVRSVLQNKSNQMSVNGWNGTNEALDTAFRLSGTEISQTVISTGIGLYGALKTTNGLGLFDILPDKKYFTTDEVLTLGQNFVGENPKVISDGVFVSSLPVGKINGRDVYARFRITNSDIEGHGLPPHANFEVVHKFVDINGRLRYDLVGGTTTTHIYFLDMP